MAAKRTLLAGIPASGKSFFGNWLAGHFGSIHVDAEPEGQLGIHGLEEAWTELAGSRNPAQLLARASRLRSEVIISWGVPPDYLVAIDALRSAGRECWWFSAPIAAARIKFLKRGEIPVSAFDRQVSQVQSCWPEIYRIFSPKIVETLSSDGVYLKPEEIYGLLFQSV